WNEIADIFSRDAVWKGDFDRFVESKRKKRGTAEVDSAFLKEIEYWRELLARNIALRNPDLTVYEMNFAVQRTIDRIIFLRICEDRSIERYGQLREQLNGDGIYSKLCRQFKRADERFNSGLFHFRKERDREGTPDTLTLNLAIDDKPLKDIITHLYYPDCPYEFSVLPTEILGHVYEQFLGKVIRLTTAHRAKVEEKPEVRKAGGVYYTPTYIVDYIVKNTVGRLLADGIVTSSRGAGSNVKEVKPKEVSEMKIVDPACGSGSFLIGAYQYLLDWHRDYYIKKGPGRFKEKIQPVTGGGWRLTTPEKKQILLNNIYGVDIDPQAVEVTKLSLLLKVLEGENEETIESQLKFFHERALPDLSQNIKCGNSLIGPDFYESEQMSLLDEEEKYRINAFDWEVEFPEIMKRGGFDGVIGNPPYVSIKGIEWNDRRYFEKTYSVKGRFDLYVLFILKAMQNCKQGGYWSFIIPNKFATNLQFREVRKFIITECKVISLVAYEGYQFKAAGVNNFVVCCKKEILTTKHVIEFQKWRKGNLENIGKQKQSTILSLPTNNFVFIGEKHNLKIVNKIVSMGKPCKFFFDVKDGIVAGGIKDVLFTDYRIDEYCHKLYFGKGVGRYKLEWTGIWVNYRPEYMMKLEVKRKGSKRPGLWMREQKIFDRPKIITRKVGSHIIATLDRIGVYYEQTLHGSLLRELDNPYDIRYFLGLLNSTVMKFYYQAIVQQEGKLFPQIRISVLEALPMFTIDFSDPTEHSNHEKMVKLVDRMLDLHKQLSKAKVPHDREVLQRQINATDRQIDQLVYELYELTEEEIHLIEETVDK
ncbi:MAG: hypothetical protein SCARUB_04979, partial [Candidatus Scalindua rubra]